MQRAVHGDAEALCDLLRVHGPGISATLRIDRSWRAQLDAADVMQVTYLEAFRYIRDFAPERAECFPSWLRQMAENNLRDAIRGLSRQKRGGTTSRRGSGATGDAEFALLAVVTTTTPSRTLRRDERHAALRRAITRLAPDYAEVVRLFDLEGRPAAAVATMMDRSTGAVHMLRARAHERLRELLGPASGFQTSS
ncbi:MAG: sigma-70 family RNA polymerase sigma factor [Planctomycetes bacterium]|nr:sigma-70 family RNA polymerase sigma factor [Planctomycetota bacterium]